MNYRAMAVLLLCLAFCAACFAADDVQCKAKNEVRPAYPDMARKLNLQGTVRVEVTLSPSGAPTKTKVVGGHPVLASAAIQAVKSSKWEPVPGDVCVATFQFQPQF